MSVKAVNKYYKQICDQYKEMIADIQDLEEEASRGLIEPERIDRLKEQVAPIKQNYERWSYMMYLLHQPNRKEKQKQYARQKKQMLNALSASNSLEAVLEENEEARKQIGV